jgi:capsular exopolysaccharide synthesis family protein
MDRELATLQDHARVLGRRWRIIAVFLVLGVAAGLGLSFMQNPVYSATATLVLEANQTSQSGGNLPTIDSQAVATQAQVVLSDAVADRVITQLDLAPTTADELVQTVSVAPSTDSTTIEVTATRPTAQGAADVADAFVANYNRLRTDQAARAAKMVRNSYVADLASIRTRLNKLQKVSQAQALAGTPSPEVDAEIQSLVARQSELEGALMVAEGPAGMPTISGHFLNHAQVPATPSAPKPLRAGVLGGVIGLIIGVLIGYARDRADDTVHAGQRLEGVIGNVPLLGQLPTAAGERRGRVAGLLDPHSGISEAYRALTTNLRFLLAANAAHGADGLDGDPLTFAGGIVVVTSASPGEGKTSVATNVAVAAARMGKRVLLVDADLRHPDVAKRFGLDAPQGFSELLLADHAPTAYLQDVGVANLQLLPAGTIPPNPAELLASPRARILWRELRLAADLVIVDTPPVLNVADTLEVVADADEVVLVVRNGQSRLRHVAAAVQRLRQVGGRFSGAVLNDLPASEVAYGYGLAYDRTAQTQA